MLGCIRLKHPERIYMKARNIFALLGLSAAMGVGAFAFASSAKVKETQAVDTTVYCKMTYDWWKADGAAIGAYYWKSSNDSDNNTWPGTRMAPVETDTDVWKFVVPSGYDKIIFTRVNGSGDIADCGAKTADLDVPTDDKVLYTITSSEAVWGDPGVTGSWSAYTEPVKTWMMRFQFNSGSASQEFPGEFGNKFTGAILHLWGDGLNYSDAYVAEKMFTHASQDYYGVNVSFTDSQVVRGAQWEVTRDGAENSQSVDIQKFGTYDNTTLDKDTPYAVIGWQYGDDWQEVEPGIWKFEFFSEYGSQVANDFWLEWDGFGSNEFTKDPATATFVYSSYTPNEAPSWITVYPTGKSVTFWEQLRQMVTPESWRCLTSGGTDTTLYLKEEGTYDIFIGNASVTIKKHTNSHSSYIYYVSAVTNPEQDTPDYIYAWDEVGNKQYGGWPGKGIMVNPDHVGENVTGVVNFEGSFKKIYRISTTTGYPTGVNKLIFNNNDTLQSEAFDMIDGAAYWWNGTGANVNAGSALDLIFDIEAKRNAVSAHGDIKNFSICGISEVDANTIVNTYNGLNADARHMVDTSTTYTYKPSGEEGETNVTFRDIVVVLGRLYDLEVIGSPRTIIGANGGAAIDSTTLIAVISIIALVSISSIVVLVVIKKRKHN